MACGRKASRSPSVDKNWIKTSFTLFNIFKKTLKAQILLHVYIVGVDVFVVQLFKFCKSTGNTDFIRFYNIVLVHTGHKVKLCSYPQQSADDQLIACYLHNWLN